MYTPTEINDGEDNEKVYTPTEINDGEDNEKVYTPTEINDGEDNEKVYTPTEEPAPVEEPLSDRKIYQFLNIFN